MDTNWLYQIISNAVSAFFSEIFFSSLGLGFFGLVTGIIVVIVLKRRGMLSRPNTMWSFVAKLNYLYLPVCFAGMFAVVGAIYGLQSQAEDWIDFSAGPVMAFGENALPVVEKMGHELSTRSDLDDALYLFADEFFEDYGVLDFTLGFVFKHCIHMLLGEFGYPETVAGLIQMSQEHNFAAPTAETLQRIPDAVKSYSGVFFNKVYLNVFFSMFPYLLIPIAEYILFLLITRFQTRNDETLGTEEISPVYV
jgi:hypothetical protein